MPPNYLPPAYLPIAYNILYKWFQEYAFSIGFEGGEAKTVGA